MQRLARIIRLAVVFGLEGGALVWLLRLGSRPWLRIDWSNLDTWLRVTPTEDAIAAMVWLVAVGCAIWLAVSTLLYLIARASRVPALIRSIEWMTLPAIRKVSEGALAALVVTSTIAATPVRAEAPPPMVVVVDEDGALLPPGFVGRGREILQEVRPAVETEVPPLPTLPSQTGADTDEAPPAMVTVQTGDNLWTMSRRHLTDLLNRPPTNQEIAPYWRRVITANQPNLISGDPDLIYAGEVIEMPLTS
jgi:hypothetical protein